MPRYLEPEQVAEFHQLVGSNLRVESGHGLRCRECERVGLHADWCPFAAEGKCAG